jgi:hypothetical protein
MTSIEENLYKKLYVSKRSTTFNKKVFSKIQFKYVFSFD